MKPAPLNYRHLHYFWVVAQEGSITRAAERLGVAVQTISAQLGLLEQSVGRALLTTKERRMVPTEAGRIALGYADQIFQLGEQLQEALRTSDQGGALRLTVGVSDALPKLIASRLLAAVYRLPQAVRLACFEGKFDNLLAELALHRLDVVLTDRPAAGSNLRVFNHPIGEFDIALFATPTLADRASSDFPAHLKGMPLLLPTPGNALRGRIERWLEDRSLAIEVVGEFEDSALLYTFGRAGLGLFPAPLALADEIASQFGALPVGELGGVREQYFAVSTERRIRHPAVEALRSAAADTRDGDRREELRNCPLDSGSAGDEAAGRQQ